MGLARRGHVRRPHRRTLRRLHSGDRRGEGYQGGEFDGRVRRFLGLSSAALAGTPHLLYFWFTGCPPCMQETPALVKNDLEYRKKGLTTVGANADEMLGLSYDDAVRKKYMEEKRITFPVVRWTRESDAAYGNISTASVGAIQRGEDLRAEVAVETGDGVGQPFAARDSRFLLLQAELKIKPAITLGGMLFRRPLHRLPAGDADVHRRAINDLPIPPRGEAIHGLFKTRLGREFHGN